MGSRNGGSGLNGHSPNGPTAMFVSDGLFHRTGYGVTADHLCRRMAADGYNVFNFAPGGLFGGLIEVAPNLTILGAQYGDDRWGNQSLAYYLNWLDPDIIITWLDAQGLVGYGWSEHPVYMWAPIDTWPIPQQEMAMYGRAAHIMVPSKWGQKVLRDQDVKADYIPCGIDLETYNISAEGRSRWREQIRPALTDDTFLIGSVGLNTGSPDRKGYGYEFDAIKEFSKRHDDFRVYIHTNAHGDAGATDLVMLRQEFGLQDTVCFSRPAGPLGETTMFMRDMYNAFDVLLHCGIAEGFGVPVIEAQACGTPVIANDCTSMSELLSEHCYRSAPSGDFVCATASRVALPSVPNLLEQMEIAYEDWKSKKHDRFRIRENAQRFEQDALYEKHWRPLLKEIPPRLDFKSGERKLALATGGREFEGFTHHDRDLLWPHIDVAHDLEILPYPWSDNSWDYIEASDILEHLNVNIVDVMDELWRIVAPGGYLYIHTAEAGSWQLNMDPTHRQGFFLQSFDYFDPDTRHGKEYSYSERKWKVVKRTEDAAGLYFVLTPRKLVPAKLRPEAEKVLAEA